MTQSKHGHIYVGVGGWTYEPWRDNFYPKGLAQKRELEYASSKLTSIEINGTYYGAQKPASFIKWREETPENFVFSLKASRFCTNRRVLAEAGPSIEKFFASGVMELKEKLGPINWQFMATKKFDPNDFEAFLKLLPKKIDGHEIRHALEVRHESFKSPDFIAMAREYGVALICGADAKFPVIADVTAPFVYVRAMGTVEKHPQGYAKKDLDAWAERAKVWATGKSPDDLELLVKPPKAQPREVFLYVISGHKAHNPAAAMALLERLS